MSEDSFEDFAGDLDALCQQRAAVYPARDRSYAALSARLVEFCRWLERSRPQGWEPDAALVRRAEALAPLFVGGYYKSGTTLVSNLLDGHPHLSALPGDAKLLRFARQVSDLPEAARASAVRERFTHELVNPTGLPPFWVFGRDASPYLSFLSYVDYWLRSGEPGLRRSMDAVARAYYAANPRRSPEARCWVDKTPFQELDHAELIALYPEMRFLHVIRSPLAVLAAMKRMAEEQGERFRLAQHVEQLKQSLQCGLSHLGNGQPSGYGVVRYEDILSDPPLTMRRLAARLDIPYADTLVEPTLNGVPSTANSAYASNRLQGTIQAQSLDRWRQHLTPHEIGFIVEALGEEASACGYEWGALRPSSLRRAELRLRRTLAAGVADPAARLVSRIARSLRRRVMTPRPPR
jgi:hypothetical protein